MEEGLHALVYVLRGVWTPSLLAWQMHCVRMYSIMRLCICVSQQILWML